MATSCTGELARLDPGALEAGDGDAVPRGELDQQCIEAGYPCTMAAGGGAVTSRILVRMAHSPRIEPQRVIGQIAQSRWQHDSTSARCSQDFRRRQAAFDADPPRRGPMRQGADVRLAFLCEMEVGPLGGQLHSGVPRDALVGQAQIERFLPACAVTRQPGVGEAIVGGPAGRVGLLALLEGRRLAEFRQELFGPRRASAAAAKTVSVGLEVSRDVGQILPQAVLLIRMLLKTRRGCRVPCRR